MKNRKRKSIKASGKNPKGGELIRSFMPSIKEEEFRRMVDGLLANPACPEITEDEAKRSILNFIEKEKTAEIWENLIYQAHVHRNQYANDMVHAEELQDKCGYISLKRKDKRPINSWQDVQTIKNRLFGIEREAIQIFPAESRMVNIANQYHIFVFPEGYIIPFGYNDGRRVDPRHRAGDCNGTSGQNFTGEQL